MDLLIDDPKTEGQFREILAKIRGAKNGETVAQMKQHGIKYKTNWGASVVSLRKIAEQYEANHVLALKLWNKQWRETMILASMLDVPAEVSEEQMDYWTKSFETAEIAEQVVMNLWAKSKFAFAKALEWCRGKKHMVRYTGLQLMGRLAITEKQTLDEMFEPFFEVLYPLSKDAQLQQVFYRSFILLGMKSKILNETSIKFARELKQSDSESASKLGSLIIDELESEFVQQQFR